MRKIRAIQLGIVLCALALSMMLTACGEAGDVTPIALPTDTPTIAVTPALALKGTLTEFPVPPLQSKVLGITAGPNGNLWFTEILRDEHLDYTGGAIGRITPAGNATDFPLPPAAGARVLPGEITAGPDGNLWFTEQEANQIGRITPTGTITIFTVPTPGSTPTGITAGPDGNVWFVEQSGQIGRITPAGQITEFPARITFPDGSYSTPCEITAGSDGNFWFTAQTEKIGRITPKGDITLFSLPTNYPANHITAGPDGALWFTEEGSFGGTAIGRMTLDGTVTEFPLPNHDSYPNGIIAGPGGALWFAEQGGRIGRITTSGVLSELEIPTPDSTPTGITVGPDGILWFTESNIGQIGRFTPGTISIPSFTPRRRLPLPAIDHGSSHAWGRVSNSCMGLPPPPHRQPRRT